MIFNQISAEIELIFYIHYFIYLLESPRSSTSCLKYIFKLRPNDFFFSRRNIIERIHYHFVKQFVFCFICIGTRLICNSIYNFAYTESMQISYFSQFYIHLNSLSPPCPRQHIETFQFFNQPHFWAIKTCVNRRTFRKGQFEVELCKCEWLINANR